VTMARGKKSARPPINNRVAEFVRGLISTSVPPTTRYELRNGVLTRVLGDNGAEGTPTGNKLVAEAITGPTNPPIGAGSNGDGSAAASSASTAGDNGGAAVTGPTAIGGDSAAGSAAITGPAVTGRGVRNVTATPIIADYSGDGS
ncbi:unnamed protein product, partial [Penicillium nalgiovense]